MGGRQFPKPVPKKSKSEIAEIKMEVIKMLPPPRPDPKPAWYQSTLLWGSASLAITIVLTVVAAMTKDLRWLLILACPFACVAVWEFVTYFVKSKRRRIAITTVAAIVIVALLYGLNVKLKPPLQVAPSQSVDTRPEEVKKPVPATQPAPAPLPAESPKPMTQAQAMAIFKKIVEGYEKEHKGKGPTLAWINNQLKEQHQPFTAFRKTAQPGPQSSFTCDDCTFEGNGTGITDANPNLKLEIHRGTFKNNGTGIVFTSPDAGLEKHDPPPAPKQQR